MFFQSIGAVDYRAVKIGMAAYNIYVILLLQENSCVFGWLTGY